MTRDHLSLLVPMGCFLYTHSSPTRAFLAGTRTILDDQIQVSEGRRRHTRTGVCIRLVGVDIIFAWGVYTHVLGCV